MVFLEAVHLHCFIRCLLLFAFLMRPNSLLIAAFWAMLPFTAAAQEGGREGSKFYEELIRSPIVPQREAEVIQSDLDAAKKQLEGCDKAISDSGAKVKEADG